jgi:hypothetical protein
MAAIIIKSSKYWVEKLYKHEVPFSTAIMIMLSPYDHFISSYTKYINSC